MTRAGDTTADMVMAWTPIFCLLGIFVIVALEALFIHA